MQRHCIYFPEDLWVEIETYKEALRRKFKRKVENSEAVRILCLKALSGGKSGDGAGGG